MSDNTIYLVEVIKYRKEIIEISAATRDEAEEEAWQLLNVVNVIEVKLKDEDKT